MAYEYDLTQGTYFIPEDHDGFVSVTMKVTDLCNLSCIPCCAAGARSAQDMDLESSTIALERLTEYGLFKVNFTGGEPLANTHTLMMLEEAKKMGIMTGLSTNLDYLMRSAAYTPGDLKGLADKVKTSIYGTRDVHDSITQVNGSYDNTIDAVAQLVSMEIPVFVQYPVFGLNRDNIPEVAKILEELGVVKLSLYSLILQGNGHNVEKISVEHIKADMEDAVLACNEDRMRLAVIDWTPRGQYIMVHQNLALTANPMPEPPYFQHLGNLRDMDLETAWQAYHHKEAHLQFYRDH